MRREWDTEVLYTDQELRSYTGASLSPGQVSQCSGIVTEPGGVSLSPASRTWVR